MSDPLPIGSAPPRPVRVMHLVYSLTVGGMELGVVKLVSGLDPDRVVSSVCGCSVVEPRQLPLPGRVGVFEFKRRDGNDPALIMRLARLLKRERTDILHTHAWGTLCEGVVAARLAGTPIVVHGEHGTMETRPRNVWIQRHLWRRVDRVLAVSSRLAERMAAEVRFPLDRITVIRNGVDLSRFGGVTDRAGARRRLGLDAESFVIGTVGRLVPVKDQRLLIRSLARLRGLGARATLVLVGDGPLATALTDEAVSLGVGDHVRLLGPRADVPDVMAAFDVFALPSLSEGLSNTILEAMASGLPVVATRVGGNDELIHDGVSGTLVPAAEVAPLTDALAALERLPHQRQAMGLAGRRRAEREFSLPGMIATYEHLYLSLAERLAGGSTTRPARALTGLRSAS